MVPEYSVQPSQRHRADHITVIGDKMPIWLVIAGINIGFFTDLLGRVPSFNPTGLGVFRYSLIAFLCIVMGSLLALLSALRAKWAISSGLRAWLGLLLGILVIMMAHSKLYGASILTIGWNGLAYTLPFAMFVGAQRKYWPLLNKVFVFHTLVAVAYAVWAFSETIYLSRELSYVSRTDIYIVGRLLYALGFVFLTFPQQSRWGKTAGVGGSLCLAILAIFTVSRANLRTVILLLSFGAIVWLGGRHRRHRQLWLTISVIVIVLVVFPWALVRTEWADQSGFYQAWRSLQARLTMHGDPLDTLLQDARWLEAQMMLQHLTWTEWLIGSGIASRWFFEGVERSIVHVGYIHLVWRGGILLLVLFFINPILIGWRTLFSSRDLMVRAAAAIAALYSIGMTTGGAPEPTLSFLLVWLAAGLCITEQGKSGGPEKLALS